MENFKSLTIWTIVLNFFIITGVGHGIACVGLIEIISLIGTVTGQIFTKEIFLLLLHQQYDKSLIAVGLFSLIGQILLLVSFAKKLKNKFRFKIAGLVFLWLGFYYLTHNFFNDSLSQIGFFTGLPFLICSIILTVRLSRQYLSEKQLK